MVAWTRFLMEEGRIREAREVLEQERRAGLRAELADAHLAAMLILEGKSGEARALAARIPERIRMTDPVVRATLQTYGLEPK